MNLPLSRRLTFPLSCRTLWHCEISRPAAPGSFRAGACAHRIRGGKPQQVPLRYRAGGVARQAHAPCRTQLSVWPQPLRERAPRRRAPAACP